MRSRFARASIAAAALLPLAAGVRFVAARTEPWPPPMVVVTPNASRLASSVSADALNAALLSRWREFNHTPLRGHLDIFGKDSVRAWDWAYLARSSARIYRQTHDERLLSAIFEGLAAYEADGRRHEAVDGFGWYTENTRTNAVYREVSITGLVIAPVIDLLLDARTDKTLAALVDPRRDELTDLVRRSIAGLDKMYLEEDGRGYYLLPAGGEIEPFNLMSIYANSLLGYWRLTGDAEALREATGIARTWKAVLRVNADGGVSWPHTARPSTIKGPSNPMDFLYKAAAAIEFPMEAYRAGLVLNRKDVEAIAAAPMTTLLHKVDDRHYWVRTVMQPELDSWLDFDAKDLGPALRPSAWYRYLCFNRQLTGALDDYLFGIDPKFYLKDGIALLAMSDRLAIAHDPGRCAPDATAAASLDQARAGAAAGATAELAATAGATRSTLR